jgi:hypothetical protein
MPSICFDSVLIFGVCEPGEGILSQEILDRYFMDSYAKQVIRGSAIDIVYGVSIDLDLAMRMSSDDVMAALKDEDHPFYNVDVFVREMRECGIKFEDPAFHLCISGDYELNQNEYEVICD